LLIYANVEDLARGNAENIYVEQLAYQNGMLCQRGPIEENTLHSIANVLSQWKENRESTSIVISRKAALKINLLQLENGTLHWFVEPSKRKIFWEDNPNHEMEMDFPLMYFVLTESAFEVFYHFDGMLYIPDISNVFNNSAVCIGTNKKLTLKENGIIEKVMEYYEDIYFNAPFTGYSDEIFDLWHQENNKAVTKNQMKQDPVASFSTVTYEILRTQYQLPLLEQEPQDLTYAENLLG
jgi:hypothetical protein